VRVLHTNTTLLTDWNTAKGGGSGKPASRNNTRVSPPPGPWFRARIGKLTGFHRTNRFC